MEPDEFADKAKQFMSQAQINLTPIKDASFVIIGNALRDITLPPIGSALRIRTQVQFSMLSFVLKIVEHHGSIDELIIATYTLNREAFNVICDLVKSGVIKSLNLLVASSYSYRDLAYKSYLTQTMKSLALEHPVHLTFAWSHFKITLAKCGRDHYLIEGSMNYSTNSMAEQVLFENCQASYESDRQFITQIMTSTGNKSLEVVC